MSNVTTAGNLTVSQNATVLGNVILGTNATNTATINGGLVCNNSLIVQGNIGQSGSSTISTGTGQTTINGNFVISGSNSFTSGTGQNTFNGATKIANNDLTVQNGNVVVSTSGKGFTTNGSNTFFCGGTNVFDSTAISAPKIINGISSGTGDGASFTTFNLAINSWFGIGFVYSNPSGPSQCNAYLNTRLGDFSTNGFIKTNATTPSTSTSTGAIVCTNGGLGVSGNINCGSTIAAPNVNATNLTTSSGNVNLNNSFYVSNAGLTTVGGTGFIVEASPMNLTNTIGQAGLSIGWNQTGGNGETDFLNYSQGGSVGGFNFYSLFTYGTTSTATNLLMSLNNTACNIYKSVNVSNEVNALGLVSTSSSSLFTGGVSNRIGIDSANNIFSIYGSGSPRVTNVWDKLYIGGSIASTSTSTGALVVAGGAGVAGNLNVGSNLNVANNLSVTGTISGSVILTNLVTETFTLGSIGTHLGGLVNGNTTVYGNLTVAAGNTLNVVNTLQCNYFNANSGLVNGNMTVFGSCSRYPLASSGWFSVVPNTNYNPTNTTALNNILGVLQYNNQYPREYRIHYCTTIPSPLNVVSTSNHVNDITGTCSLYSGGYSLYWDAPTSGSPNGEWNLRTGNYLCTYWDPASSVYSNALSGFYCVYAF